MDSDVKLRVKNCLSNLSTEAEELYLNKFLPEVDGPPTALRFYRDFVSPNKPVIFNNAINHWPALKEWNSQYFRETIGHKEVTVAVTPNGYADAVTKGKFVLPEQRIMKMCEFLDILDSPKETNGVFYIQKQNSNLTDEFQCIMKDVDQDISWASEAFDKQPDAVNFWMGDERAITSMHRDHYENLYCVVSGWKKFILIPPTDQPFIPYDMFEVGTFKEMEDGQFVIEDTAEGINRVPWIDIDPLKPSDKHPAYRNAHVLEVTVSAGQMLYLPSLWFHHVRQSHGCIAVNYWYDMEFDIKYNYYKCVENLMDIVK